MKESTKPQPDLTVEQYLELERKAPVRHDLVGGLRHTIPETSQRHDHIVDNIFRELADAAEDTLCRVFKKTTRLRTPNGSVYYPDVMVVCEPGTGDPELQHEPCLIVEVTSPGTETIDHREKWGAYNRIPSLKAYLIVDQDRQRVERYFRLESGTWLRAVEIDDGAFHVPCPEIVNLYLVQIYAGL